jgi:hypothetical protein
MCNLFSLFVYDFIVSDFIIFHVVFILFVELIILLLYLALFASVITLDSILQYCL